MSSGLLGQLVLLFLLLFLWVTQAHPNWTLIVSLEHQQNGELNWSAMILELLSKQKYLALSFSLFVPLSHTPIEQCEAGKILFHHGFLKIFILLLIPVGYRLININTFIRSYDVTVVQVPYPNSKPIHITLCPKLSFNCLLILSPFFPLLKSYSCKT